MVASLCCAERIGEGRPALRERRSLPRLMKEFAEHAIAQGHGAENYFAMFEIFRKPGAGTGGRR
jgi:hypothetical protein